VVTSPRAQAWSPDSTLRDVVGEELGVQPVDRVPLQAGCCDHDLRVEVEPVAGSVLDDLPVRLLQELNLLGLGADLLGWAEEFFGCAVNEAYGQTELNGICGNSAAVYPVKPGSLGRVVKMLAEADINLDYAYASGIDRMPMVAVVMGVADALRASAATGI